MKTGERRGTDEGRENSGFLISLSANPSHSRRSAGPCRQVRRHGRRGLRGAPRLPLHGFGPRDVLAAAGYVFSNSELERIFFELLVELFPIVR